MVLSLEVYLVVLAFATSIFNFVGVSLRFKSIDAIGFARWRITTISLFLTFGAVILFGSHEFLEALGFGWHDYMVSSVSSALTVRNLINIGLLVKGVKSL